MRSIAEGDNEEDDDQDCDPEETDPEADDYCDPEENAEYVEMCNARLADGVPHGDEVLKEAA